MTVVRTVRGRLGVAVVAAAAIAAIAIALVAWGEETRPSVPAGFNNNAVTGGLAAPETAAELIAEVGAEIDRVQVDWATLEPQPGAYDWSIYDEIYRADLARGLRPLFIFAFAPPWASAGPCDSTVPGCHVPPAPSHYADAARTAAAIARRYPDLAGIEIWNEPNTPYFWAPAADPAAYTELLKACYAAIKRAAPATPVLGGSTASGQRSDGGYVRAPDFVRAIYEAGGGEAMDVLSVHAYPDPGDWTGRSAAAALEEVRSVQEDFDGADQPIWVTETGVSTSGPEAVSEQAQALTVVRLYEALADAGAATVLFHTLVSARGDPSNPETGYGLVSSELEAQPAYCALADALGGAASC